MSSVYHSACDLNQNYLEQKKSKTTVPWPGYVMLLNPLTHFCQFQKVDSFVDGWKNFCEF